MNCWFRKGIQLGFLFLSLNRINPLESYLIALIFTVFFSFENVARVIENSFESTSNDCYTQIK
jgi:hypothetical protein